MNRFLKHWRLTGRGEAFRAHVVSYADDFVILSRGHAEEALAWTRAVMTKLGLTLNEAKTSVKDARRESFDFLGYTFGPAIFQWWPVVSGRKPIQEERAADQDESQRLADAGQQGCLAEVRTRLNRLLGGWSAYFSLWRRLPRHTSRRPIMSTTVCATSLCKRHKVQGRGTKRFSREYVYGELGVLRLRRGRGMSPPCASR